MLKLSHPITSINGFKIGNKVRLKDGDGRPHIIKSFSIDGMKEFFFEVQFEDGTETMLNNIAPLTSNLDMAAEEYAENILAGGEDMFDAIADAFKAGSEWKEIYLQPEQPDNMIQWTGNNLKEVIDFTGKSPRFGEYFNSWEEYENYVHTHNDILKLFCEDGNHYEVPVGAWIVKTPEGYKVPSVAKKIQQVQLKVDLEGEVEKYFGDYWKNCPLLVQRELINFARTFIAKGYIMAKGL